MVLLTARLTDSSGTPLQGKTIRFYANSVMIDQKVTDENGIATTTHTPTDTTIYVAEFPGDEYYEASRAEVTYTPTEQQQQCKPIFKTGISQLDTIIFCVSNYGITTLVLIAAVFILLLILRR